MSDHDKFDEEDFAQSRIFYSSSSFSFFFDYL